MFGSWINPVVKDYLFHDSPLRKSTAKWTLWTIVAVVAVVSFLGWRGITHGQGPLIILRWVPLTILGSILGYLILSFLDRERRVGYFHFLTILSVMLVTGPAAAFFNDLTEPPVRFILVGFWEEAFKILPVLLLAIYVPNLIRTRKDGIVYGALAGIGFNIIEIGVYINKALAEGSLWNEALVMHLTRLGIFGLGGHIIWSAFVGLGIGIAAESTKSGWAKWRTPFFYYLLAAISHSLFDNLAQYILVVWVMGETFVTGVDFASVNPNAGVLGPFNNGMRFTTYLWNAIFIIILIVQIRRSFARENTIQVEELSTEEPVIMREEELERLKAEKLLSKRKYKEYPKDVSNKLVLYQNLLAMQKHTARQFERAMEEVEPVVALRRAIRSLRSTT